LIDASLLSKYKEECQALVCTSIRVLITYNELKNEEDMELKLDMGLNFFFFNFFEINYLSLSSCILCVYPLLLVFKEHFSPPD
jgi:hypothetical protein